MEVGKKVCVINPDDFMSGDMKYMVRGQKFEYHRYDRATVCEVIVADQISKMIIARVPGTTTPAMIGIGSGDAKPVFSFYGAAHNGGILFPGDEIVITEGELEFNGRFILKEDDDIRVFTEIEDEVVDVVVPAGSVSVKKPDYAEVGEWVRIGSDYYVIAMVEASKWALINVMRGGRFLDAEEDGLGVVDGRWCVPKDVIIGQAEVVRENPEFLGKMKCISEEEQV